MRKLLLPFLVVLFSSLYTSLRSQQCSPGTIACIDTLASNIAIISASGTYDFSDTCIWVCPGITVTLVNGAQGYGMNNVYVEANATVNISSSINGVMAKAGAAVNLRFGSTGTLVICEPGAIITQNGSPWTANCTCEKVIFDYSYVSSLPGCVLTGTEADAASTTLHFFPNPAKDFVTINSSGFAETDEVILRNLLGIQLSAYPLSGKQLTINLSSLAPGIYFLSAMKNGTSTLIKKLVIGK